LLAIAGVYIVCLIFAWLNLHLGITQAFNVVGRQCPHRCTEIQVVLMDSCALKVVTLAMCATRLHRSLIVCNDGESSTGASSALAMSAPRFAHGRTRPERHDSKTIDVRVDVHRVVDYRYDSNEMHMSKLGRKRGEFVGP
jgi:hypothetical protein